MKKADLINQKFGNLTVIKLAGTGSRGLLWDCLCVCGKIYEKIYTSELNYGKRLGCGCERGFRSSLPDVDLIGKRFGLLCVIRKDSVKGTNQYWLCACNCGAKTKVSTASLRSKTTQGCGDGVCRRKITKLKGIKTPEQRISMCKQSTKYRGSKNRRFTWEITDKEELKLIELIRNGRCTYCGVTSEEMTTPHGLDRIDNSIINYRMDTVAICCRICNIAKGTMTVEEFKTWLKKASTYTNEFEIQSAAQLLTSCID